MRCIGRSRSISYRGSRRYFSRAYAESRNRFWAAVVRRLLPYGGRAKYQSGRSMDASGPAIVV